MGGNPEGKNNDVGSEDYPEEHKELGLLALTLVGNKYLKLDFQTANDIERMNRKVLDGYIDNPLLPVNEVFIKAILLNGVLELKVPDHGKPIDGFTPPKFPPIENLRGQIGKCGLPFEKQLTDSDVKDDQSRLIITKDLVKEFINPLMNKEEYESSMTVKGIQVMSYDCKGNQFPMKFKMWSGGKSRVLTSGWKNFYKDNKFKAYEDWITCWFFRHSETGELCFAIMARRFPIHKLLPKIRKQKRECATWENCKKKQNRKNR